MPWRLPSATLALVVTLLCGVGAVRAEPDALPDSSTPVAREVDARGDAGPLPDATADVIHDTGGAATDVIHDTGGTPTDVPDTGSTATTDVPGDAHGDLGADVPSADATPLPDADALDTSSDGSDANTADGADLDAHADVLTPADAADTSHGSAKPSVPPPKGTTGPTLSTGDAIKAIFGLVLLMALAWLGGHPKVQRLEQKLRISQVITAGFPFVLIGLVSREGGLGILSQPVLDAIRPLLPLGLGWIGFAVGFRFDVRRLDGMPKLTAETFVATTALPYLFIVGAVAGLFYLTSDAHDPLVVIRDATILATAGAMTAVSLPRFLARQGTEPSAVDRITCIIQLEELAALLGVILIGAFFRPDQADLGWRLPSVGWVFVTLGIGTALSGVIFAILGTIKGQAETLVVMLGSICFAAGMASFLRLSPVVVCFIAGAVLQNFPGPWKAQVRSALARIERPVYLLFLIIAGALWRVDEWQGWVLMLVFVVARLIGRQGGVFFFARRHPGVLSAVEQRHLAISPMGALSLAIIVTAQDLYSGPTVPWMVNAVIGGAILTEVVVQTFAFGGERARTRTAQRMTRSFFPAYVDPPPRDETVPPPPVEEPR